MPHCLSTLGFMRSDAERRDQFVAWARDDVAFFAAGACHILAYAFADLHCDEGFVPLLIRPYSGSRGVHMCATDGTWAFDFNGWTLEEELLRVNAESYMAAHPGWGYERIVINQSLETFCATHRHRLPGDFAHSPWDRALKYIERFPVAAPRLCMNV